MGVDFTEYDVSRDQRAAEEMVRLTGQMGVPVTVIDGQTVIGFDQARIKTLLARVNGNKPRFGLKIADASRVAHNTGITAVSGAVIGAVSPSSLGEKAGLKPGDVITEINKKRIKTGVFPHQIKVRVCIIHVPDLQFVTTDFQSLL